MLKHQKGKGLGNFNYQSWIELLTCVMLFQFYEHFMRITLAIYFTVYQINIGMCYLFHITEASYWRLLCVMVKAKLHAKMNDTGYNI